MSDIIVKAPKSMIHGDEMILLNADYMLSFFKNPGSLCFIEIGSQRGTGSTFRLSRFANKNGMHFITIDADENNSKGAKEIISKVNSSFEAHHQLGEVYLKNFDLKNIGICYLDAFDLIVKSWPHVDSTVQSYTKRGAEFTNEAAYKMHLEASEAIVEKVIPGGFICFDDVWKDETGSWQGKGKTAIPYLLKNGYKEICYYKNSALFQRINSLDDEAIKKVESYNKPFRLGRLYLRRKLASIIG